MRFLVGFEPSAQAYASYAIMLVRTKSFSAGVRRQSAVGSSELARDAKMKRMVRR
jgi:hypothetical protein